MLTTLLPIRIATNILDESLFRALSDRAPRRPSATRASARARDNETNAVSAPEKKADKHSKRMSRKASPINNCQNADALVIRNIHY